MGTTKRIEKWDNVKFVLILSVVIGHFLQRYDESLNAKRLIYFIYLFHMPAFIFISGLFAKSTINKKKYDKIFSFLVLFLVTKFSLFGINYLIGASKKFKLLEMNDVSWYAFVVFVFYLITIFFRRFSKVYILVFSILVSCVIGFAKDVSTYLSLSRIFTYYPIFIIGYYLDINKVLEFSKKKIVIAASWVVIVLSGFIVYFKINEIYWFLTILKGKRGYSSMRTYAENGFHWH